MYGAYRNQDGLGESVNHITYINQGNLMNPNQARGRGVYLEGCNLYEKPAKITQVAPTSFAHQNGARPAFEVDEDDVVFDRLKPMLMVLRGLGIFPIASTQPGLYTVTPTLLGYSVGIVLIIGGLLAYTKIISVGNNNNAERKFEEAVIDYLFTVYLFPIVLVPISWYEARKMAVVYTDWAKFESVYRNITGRSLNLFVGNKVLFTTIALPTISCGIMIVTHLTMMGDFKIVQIIPFCYINTLTYVIGGIWYLQCDVVGRVATIIAEDFEKALRHVGPSALVAEHRALWMILSKLTRDIGLGCCYALTFLALYLFLVITLTIYGLLSQIQEGLGVKDVGLTVTAGMAVAFLYFVCDEAHYASNCVKVNFQKKILLVELSWMNDDAQQEINMFLRATEMNDTNMSLGGFFDVNRTLFKSLLATMVTYLVVLLQFQISLPEESSLGSLMTTSAPLSASSQMSVMTTKK